MAIESLEKQIAKKPIGKRKRGYTNNICPNCNYSVTLELSYGGLLDCDYCPNCGQAIDWSE